jgi:large subunit ribosomal protein L35
MPKMKSHRGAMKRFSLTAKGKVKFKHANLRHCLEQKGTDRKKKLVKTGIMDDVDAKRVRRLLAGG